MSERLSQGERKCFDKIFQIVRGENGTLDKLEYLTSSLKALSGALSANRALSPYDDNYKDAKSAFLLGVLSACHNRVALFQTTDNRHFWRMIKILEKTK